MGVSVANALVQLPRADGMGVLGGAIAAPGGEGGLR